MKLVAKWLAIIWSILCLIGAVYIIAHGAGSFVEMVSSSHSQHLDPYQTLGLGAGIVLNLIAIVMAWLSIAGPAFVIYAVSGNQK
jgi:hypothetical protein